MVDMVIRKPDHSTTGNFFSLDHLKYTEKNSLLSNHEITIISLNTQMAEKAEAQIRLNEQRDNLRETNKDVF